MGFPILVRHLYIESGPRVPAAKVLAWLFRNVSVSASQEWRLSTFCNPISKQNRAGQALRGIYTNMSKTKKSRPFMRSSPSSRKTKRSFGMPQYLFLSNISVNLMQCVYLEPIMHCAPLLDAWINRINIADGFVRNYIIQGSDCHMHNRWLAGQHYTVLVSRGLWTQITTDGGLS